MKIIWVLIVASTATGLVQVNQMPSKQAYIAAAERINETWSSQPAFCVSGEDEIR